MTENNKYGLSELQYKALKSDPEKIHKTLDLKEMFPDFFVQTDRMPKKLRSIWLNPTQIHCNVNDARYYFDLESSTVHIFYISLPEAGAKSKIIQLRDVIIGSLQKAIAAGSDNFKQAVDPNVKPKKNTCDQELANVIKHGLRAFPSHREVQLWSERVRNSYSLGDGTPKEILDIVKDYRFAYNPIINNRSANQIGSYIEVDPLGRRPKNIGRVLRNNIASLHAASFEISRLMRAGEYALVVVPLDVRGFTDKYVSKLLLASLEIIPKAVRKYMLIEVRGLTGGSIQPMVGSFLARLAKLCRSVKIDTGILAMPNYTTASFTPFAYGFSFTDVTLPESNLRSLMVKYARSYHDIGAKIYIRNIPNDDILAFASELGFTLLSGAMVFSPLTSCALCKKVRLPQSVSAAEQVQS